MAFHTGAGKRGFTLIELLVVLAILALLLTIAAPRFFRSVDQSKETVLKENLHITREVIDKFYGDNGRYPHTLGELIERKYLRSLPLDPMTESTSTWILVAPDNAPGVYNLYSGASGNARDGMPFSRL
ncbi:MAG TPA: prepilin-type N-terminal cleavage/methylation domain-containing protein [Telluria sp.]|jgi:general secretion pathway protein G